MIFNSKDINVGVGYILYMVIGDDRVYLSDIDHTMNHNPWILTTVVETITSASQNGASKINYSSSNKLQTTSVIHFTRNKTSAMNIRDMEIVEKLKEDLDRLFHIKTYNSKSNKFLDGILIKVDNIELFSKPSYIGTYREVSLSFIDDFPNSKFENDMDKMISIEILKDEPTFIRDWNDMRENVKESDSHIIDQDEYSAHISPKKDSKYDTVSDHHTYLSTHTFYGETHIRSTKTMRKHGFNVTVNNWDVDTHPSKLPINRTNNYYDNTNTDMSKKDTHSINLIKETMNNGFNLHDNRIEFLNRLLDDGFKEYDEYLERRDRMERFGVTTHPGHAGIPKNRRRRT